jgi:hypothetical protein
MSFVSKRGSGGNLFTYIYLVSVYVYLEIVSVCHFIYIETSLNQMNNCFICSRESYDFERQLSGVSKYDNFTVVQNLFITAL